MEVSPTGPPAATAPAGVAADPVTLLHALLNLQSQTLEVQRQILQNQQQQLELAREATQFARDQRARQMAELERWQQGHEPVVERCRESLGQLEQVHSALMGELTDHVAEHHENLLDGDFALTDFVDKFGPRLAHLNAMLSVLRPLAATPRKPDAPPAAGEAPA